MIKKISSWLRLSFSSSKKEYCWLNKAKFKLSLLGVLMGIFLFPNLAYLSTIEPEKLIELTNQERQTAGLSALTANQLLTQAAILKAKAILETNTFKHTIDGKRFSAWIRDTGYNYSYVGENLAIDFATSEAVMQAWENSPLHKKNLLSPYYQEIGVSTMPGKYQGQDTMVVVQIFGAPAAGSVQPWSEGGERAFLESNLTLPETSLSDPQLLKAENLLTHAIMRQETLPLDNNKLALPSDKLPVKQANTFIAQPDFRAALNNFLLIFLSWSAIYLLIYLYSYYFLKINKLISTRQ